jgi:hypothetical protein
MDEAGMTEGMIYGIKNPLQLQGALVYKGLLIFVVIACVDSGVHTGC